MKICMFFFFHMAISVSLCLCTYASEDSPTMPNTLVQYHIESSEVERAHISMGICFPFAGIVGNTTAAGRLHAVTSQHVGDRLGVFVNDRMFALVTVQAPIELGRISLVGFTTAAAAETALHSFLPPETPIRPMPETDRKQTDTSGACPKVFAVSPSMIYLPQVEEWGDLFLVTAELQPGPRKDLTALQTTHGADNVRISADGFLTFSFERLGIVDERTKDAFVIGVFASRDAADNAAMAWLAKQN